MESAKREQYERPQARVVEFGEGDMGRVVTASGDSWEVDTSGNTAPSPLNPVNPAEED